MFESKIIIKSVLYRLYAESDNIISKYYIQFSRDQYENPYNLEITADQFNILLNDGRINRVCMTSIDLPKTNEMPIYGKHYVSVDLYELVIK